LKILLIWPCARNEVLGWGTLGAVAEPLALEYLAGGAKRDGHEVRILDLRLHPDTLPVTLAEFTPDVVGVTGFSMHVLPALAACRIAKEHLPNCVTVAGGHHATLIPADFFEPYMDYVVCGEGVQPFNTLLKSLEDPAASVPPIPGIWARHPHGFQWGGEQPELVLDELPVPDRQTTAPDRHRYFIDIMEPVALVRTSVGCPYRCSFCSLWKIMDGLYHRHDVNRVVEEIGSVEEEWIFLVDDEPFIDGKRMYQIAKALHDRGVRKRYFAYCRIDSLLRETEALKAWKEIGLDRLFIGIEAISDEGLLDFSKKLVASQVEAGIKKCRELGILVWGQFIVRPDFTKRSFTQLARFIEHHRIDYPSFTILTPIPGTGALTSFDHVLAKQSNGRPDWDQFDCQHPVTQTTLPPEQFLQEYRNLQRVFRRGKFANYWATGGLSAQAAR
jgi:radical SAM superfamily enzyme YgiQ (UPF0313 family)